MSSLSPENLLFVPCGLILLFFGVYTLRHFLLVLTALFTARFTYDFTIWVYVDEVTAFGVAVITSSLAFAAVLFASAKRAPTGFLLGTCIALSLMPVSSNSYVLERLGAVIVLGTAFALMMFVAERQVLVFVSAFAGSYLIWRGLEMLDAETVENLGKVPALVSAANVDMWFSVMSFLVVGCLGCSVQFILLGGQPISSQYQAIP